MRGLVATYGRLEQEPRDLRGKSELAFTSLEGTHADRPKSAVRPRRAPQPWVGERTTATFPSTRTAFLGNSTNPVAFSLATNPTRVLLLHGCVGHGPMHVAVSPPYARDTLEAHAKTHLPGTSPYGVRPLKDPTTGGFVLGARRDRALQEKMADFVRRMEGAPLEGHVAALSLDSEQHDRLRKELQGHTPSTDEARSTKPQRDPRDRYQRRLGTPFAALWGESRSAARAAETSDGPGSRVASRCSSARMTSCER